MAAYGLYTHIASNKFRSMLLLAGLFLLIYVLVYAGALLAEVVINSDRSVDYYLMAAARDLVTAFPYATGAAALWIVIAYFFHQNMIDAVTGGEDVTRKQQPRLYNLLENLCISRGIPMPKLKIMDSDALNAFASGLNRRQYAVTVTTGLLKALERSGDRGGARPRAHPHPQRRRAADGDRGDHRRRGRLLRRAVLPDVHQSELEFHWRIVVGSSSSSSSSSSDSDSKGSGGGAVIVVIIAVALIVLAWLLSQVVKLALSRSRELLADAGSVELTKNPDAMISALRKIENRGELAGRHLGGDGIVHRQSARGLCRPVRDPPFGGFPGAGAGEISPAGTIPAGWRCRRIPKAQRTTTSPSSPRPPTGSAVSPLHGAPGATPPPARRSPSAGAAEDASQRPLGPAPSEISALSHRAVLRNRHAYNRHGGLKELNSPLFLPCSRPKQVSGHADRSRDRRRA